VGEREVETPKNIPLGSQVDFLRKAQLAIMLDFRNVSGGAFRLKFEPIIRSRLYKKRKDHIIVLNWEISNKGNWFFTTATQARFV